MLRETARAKTHTQQPTREVKESGKKKREDDGEKIDLFPYYTHTHTRSSDGRREKMSFRVGCIEKVTVAQVLRFTTLALNAKLLTNNFRETAITLFTFSSSTPQIRPNISSFPIWHCPDVPPPLPTQRERERDGPRGTKIIILFIQTELNERGKHLRPSYTDVLRTSFSLFSRRRRLSSTWQSTWAAKTKWNSTLLYSSETNKKRQEKRRRLFLGWLIDQVSDKSASSRADGLYSRPSKQQQRQDGVDSSKSIGTSAHYSTCVRDGRRRREKKKKRVASPTTPPLLLRMTCSWFPKGQVFVVPAKINSLRGSCPPPSQSGTSLVVAPRSHPTAAQLSRWCWWWELPSAPVYVLFFSLYSFLVPFFSARKDNGSQLNATDTHTN